MISHIVKLKTLKSVLELGVVSTPMKDYHASSCLVYFKWSWTITPVSLDSWLAILRPCPDKESEFLGMGLSVGTLMELVRRFWCTLCLRACVSLLDVAAYIL